jgi:hypothetical protein
VPSIKSYMDTFAGAPAGGGATADSEGSEGSEETAGASG